MMCDRFPPIARQSEEGAYLAFAAVKIAVRQRLSDCAVGLDLVLVLSVVPPMVRLYPLGVPAGVVLCPAADLLAVLLSVSQHPEAMPPGVDRMQFALAGYYPVVVPFLVLSPLHRAAGLTAGLAVSVAAVASGPVAVKLVNGLDLPAAGASFAIDDLRPVRRSFSEGGLLALSGVEGSIVDFLF